MLTNTAVERLSLKKGNRHADEKGLYLFITPSGTKSWRFDYRWPKTATGKRQCLTYGKFPEVSLAEARERHLEARKILASGVNPAFQKREQRRTKVAEAGNTFRAVAEKWYSAKSGKHSENWRRAARRWLEHCYQEFGNRAFREVSPAAVLAVMRSIEAKGYAHSAERIRQMVTMIYDYAAVSLIIDSGFNPARGLRGAVIQRAQKNHPHISVREIPEFFAAMSKSESGEQVKTASRLLFLTWVRISELLKAAKAEVDLERAVWEIPAARMKNGIAHLVPLSSQAVAEFRKAIEQSGDSNFIFPNKHSSSRPMTCGALNRLFVSIGFKGRLSPHGTRSTASTAANELGFRADVIERQLAHVEVDKVRGAYNRADYLQERRQMLQAWADLIDSACAGRTSPQNVIPIARAAA